MSSVVLEALLHRVFDKPFYHEWAFWLTLTSIVLIVINIIETTRLYKETRKQNKLNRRPYPSFTVNKDKPGEYIIVNDSPHPAFNVLAILKNNSDYRIPKLGHIIPIMSPGSRREIEHGDWISADESAVIKNISSATKLLNYLKQRQENGSCLLYEDILGNKLYSIFFVSSPTLGYDECAKVGYLNDLVF
jgi:hypothetical protein